MIVITASERDGVNDDILGVLEVNPIRVWAVSRGRNAHPKDLNSNATVEFEVCLLAVLNCYARNCHITTSVKPQCLEVKSILI